MPSDCSTKPMRFAHLKGRDVEADFGGGAMTSNAGELLPVEHEVQGRMVVEGGPPATSRGAKKKPLLFLMRSKLPAG